MAAADTPEGGRGGGGEEGRGGGRERGGGGGKGMEWEDREQGTEHVWGDVL